MPEWFDRWRRSATGLSNGRHAGKRICSWVGRLAAVDVVASQAARESEFAEQRAESGFTLRGRIFFDLQITLHNQPADVVRTRLFHELSRRVGLRRGIEEQHRKLRHAPCGKVEGVFPGEKDQAIGQWNVGGGKA